MKALSIESLESMIDSFQNKSEDWLEHHADILTRLKRQRKLLIQFQKEYFGPGYTLKHSEQNRWRVVLADPTEPGRFRWLEFDENGFSGHYIYDTPNECLGDMVDGGFVVPDHEALERHSDTPEWRKGSAITAVIQASNNRLINWKQALEQIAEIRATYEKEVA